MTHFRHISTLSKLQDN